MIGLDTNVLVRLFAKDDSIQRERAIALIDGQADGERAVVNIVVVAELVWVLGRVYRFERDEIAAALRKLTEHPKIDVLDKDIVRDAAHRAREEGGGVADHLIGLINRRRGCTVTYTFDGDAAQSSDFALLP